MNGVNLIIGCVAVFGFLPLGIVLYRRRAADRILTTGRSTRAIVYHKYTSRKPSYEVVYYQFTAFDGKRYTGKLTGAPGLYNIHDTLEVFYSAANPKHNTVKGAWKSYGILIFVIIIAIWVLYMS